MQDYFSLFGLAPDFALEAAELTRRYRDIQSQIHPDRYAGKGDQEQRMAVQTAAFVNEAYQCLKQPLSRAEYLLGLAGHPLSREQHTHQDAAFLMEQIDLREELEAIGKKPERQQALDKFLAELDQRIAARQQLFASAFAARQYESAADSVLKWQFLAKLKADADKLHDD